MKLLFDENLSRKLVGGRIKVVSRKQAVDGKSVLSLMLLGATPGTEITIEARNEDEGERAERPGETGIGQIWRRALVKANEDFHLTVGKVFQRQHHCSGQICFIAATG